ncbi:MAG: helix-turn-helix domain-containing protein, partial [Desulforhopalus sp.]
YHWPGNVRELQNIIERALILNPQGPIAFENLGGAPLKSVDRTDFPAIKSYNLDETVAHHISSVLKITSGKVNGADGAAELLGVNPSTLRNKMNKLGISYGRKT